MSHYTKLYTAEDTAVVFIDHQPQMTFGVANIDRQTLINNTVMLFSGLDLIYNEEQGKHLEDEKRLLQSQVNLERRKLEAESERLRLEAMKLEAERAKFEEERKRLASKTMSEDSTTSTTSADTTSLESSSSTSGTLISNYLLEGYFGSIFRFVKIDFMYLCYSCTLKICIPSLN